MKRKMFENEKSCRAVATIILNYGRKLCVRNVKVRICVCFPLSFFLLLSNTRDRQLTSGESASWHRRSRTKNYSLWGLNRSFESCAASSKRKTERKNHKLLSLTENIFGVRRHNVHSRFGWRKFINSSKYRTVAESCWNASQINFALFLACRRQLQSVNEFLFAKIRNMPNSECWKKLFALVLAQCGSAPMQGEENERRKATPKMWLIRNLL